MLARGCVVYIKQALPPPQGQRDGGVMVQKTARAPTTQGQVHVIKNLEKLGIERRYTRNSEPTQTEQINPGRRRGSTAALYSGVCSPRTDRSKTNGPRAIMRLGSRCPVSTHTRQPTHTAEKGLDWKQKADQNRSLPARETSASDTKLSAAVLMVAKAILAPFRVGAYRSPQWCCGVGSAKCWLRGSSSRRVV